jgi:hypothetical protein
MKKSVVISAALLISVSSAMGQAVAPEISSWIRNTTGATGYNGLPSNVQTVQYSSSQVYVSCSCIPGYNIGPWASNPNVPTNQNLVHKITRTPVQNTGAAIYTGLGSIGLWSNGVVIFNPKDGYYWNNSTSAFANGSVNNGWNRNAKYYEGVSFDACLGHPAPNGAYHNHVNPTCLYSATNTSVHSPIIGYAFDGYPVYGAYAYTNTNGTGSIKRMVSSYQLAASTGSILLGSNTATPAASPTAASTRSLGPPVNTTYPLGCMCEDYIYIAGSGDLDEHNGRFCVTPEYPSGTYAYFVTIDASGTPVYPFVIGPTYYGTVQSGNTGPSGGHVTITEATTTYTGTGTVATSVKEIPQIKYEVMPNPSSDYVYIYMDINNENNVKLSLYNQEGKLVYSQNFLQPSIAYTLDMRTYSAGVYNMVLESATQTSRYKLVKSK